MRVIPDKHATSYVHYDFWPVLLRRTKEPGSSGQSVYLSISITDIRK